MSGDMKQKIFFAAVCGLIGMLTACGSLQNQVRIEGREAIVPMTASDFKFQPNNIATRTGETITFRIQNTSGTTHNFTLKEPDGTTIRNVDIPPGQSVDVTVTFSKAGTYPFDCNKTGHATLGMKGQVVATGE